MTSRNQGGACGVDHDVARFDEARRNGSDGLNRAILANDGITADERLTPIARYDLSNIYDCDTHGLFLSAPSEVNRSMLHRPLRIVQRKARQEVIHQIVGFVPCIGPVAMTSGDKLCTGIKHLVLGMA